MMLAEELFPDSSGDEKSDCEVQGAQIDNENAEEEHIEEYSGFAIKEDDDVEDSEEIKHRSARIPRKRSSTNHNTGHQHGKKVKKRREVISTVYASHLINEMMPFLLESVLFAHQLDEEIKGNS